MKTLEMPTIKNLTDYATLVLNSLPHFDEPVNKIVELCSMSIENGKDSVDTIEKAIEDINIITGFN